MKYILRKLVLGSVPELKIAKAEFESFKTARGALLSAFAIEETFEVLVANYFDLEKELLVSAAKDLIKSAYTYESFYGLRLRLNVKLVNLLTAARLFLDHLPQHVGPKGSEGRIRLKKATNTQYDTFFEYRFMEQLRNYVQHRGMPVHSYGTAASKVGPEGERSIKYTCTMASTRERIAEDDTFKPAVLEEMPEKIDLIGASRRYMECLSAVHSVAREIVGPAAADGRASIENAHSRYREHYSESLVGLAAVAVAKSGEFAESVPLLLDWDDVRLKLLKENRELKNLSKRFVAGL